MSPDPRLESNKQTVLDFYEAAFNTKEFAAAARLISDSYTQHNPLIADGTDGLRARLGSRRTRSRRCVSRSNALLPSTTTLPRMCTVCVYLGSAGWRSSTFGNSTRTESLPSTGMSYRRYQRKR